jgi:hypothetical protein
MAKLPKSVTDLLMRTEWKLYMHNTWVKDGYLLTIQKLQNHNFAIEIQKMSVANVRNVSVDELDSLIRNPRINY